MEESEEGDVGLYRDEDHEANPNVGPGPLGTKFQWAVSFKMTPFYHLPSLGEPDAVIAQNHETESVVAVDRSLSRLQPHDKKKYIY